MELASYLNREGKEIRESAVDAEELAWVVRSIADEAMSSKTAKVAFQAMWETKVKTGLRSIQGAGQLQVTPSVSAEAFVASVIQERGLRQISDAGALDAIVAEVLAANPKQVEDYRAGKEKAFNSLVGQVMKATKGKANPAQVNEILKSKLAGG